MRITIVSSLVERRIPRLRRRECQQEEGLTALVSGRRRDKGKHRISDFWENFIIKTYQQGNKGSKRMNPKQVALRVEAKASEMGDEQPPSYRTVLRVLEPILNKQKKTQ